MDRTFIVNTDLYKSYIIYYIYFLLLHIEIVFDLFFLSLLNMHVILRTCFFSTMYPSIYMYMDENMYLMDIQTPIYIGVWIFSVYRNYAKIDQICSLLIQKGGSQLRGEGQHHTATFAYVQYPYGIRTRYTHLWTYAQNLIT